MAVPAVMVYSFEIVPLDWIFARTTSSLIAAATIMAVSCYTFANVGMKSEDYYFVGFPAIWNVVVLYFYVLDTGWLVNGLTIIILSILTFIPIKFVHPLRVAHWRNITVPMTVLWAAMALSLVISSKDEPDRGHVQDPAHGLDWRFALFRLDFPVADLRSGRSGPG